MATVDDRVVQLEFDNSQFRKATAETLSTLEKLKTSLDFSSSRKGVDDLDRAFSRFNLGNIGATIEGVNSKFLAMATVGVTALATIAQKAISVGASLVKSLSIDPINEGFKDYNLKLSSVQTIMNATGESITTVNKYFSELDTYADKTVFNLRDMTGAFAKFTNAGVDMKVSIPAIKGIANMVALAGQGAGEASIAFYNLSQSIAGGYLTTTDYKSLNLANVATKEWKDQMVAGAVAAGTLKKVGTDAFEIVGKKGGMAFNTAKLFNEQLSEGWASAQVLTNVLGDFGDESTAIGKKALAAAQDVKSLPMMFETLKASVGTGWTSSFEIILGNVTESTAMFTDFTVSIQSVLDTWSNARNTLLADWKALGGRAVAIDAIKNAFKALTSIIKPIKDAFREIFPAKTGQDLYNLTVTLRDFFESLTLSVDTADKVKRTFAGVFALFSIGKSILSGFIGIVVDLFKSFSGVGSGFLDATASIGDFLVRVDAAIKDGALIPFFSKLNDVMAPVNGVIRAIAGAFEKLFSGQLLGNLAVASDGFGKISERISPLKGLANTLAAAWGRFIGLLQDISPFLGELLQNFKDAFSKIPQIMQESVSNGNYSAMLDTINTAIFGGIALLFRKFMKNGFKSDGSEGFLKTITGTFGELTNTLKAMQTQLKAKALRDIAIAVGILVASLVVLALIPSDKLTKALVALAATFTQLLAAMAVIDKISSSSGFLKLPVVAAALILLSTAMLILSAALLVMSSMSWEEIGKGLTTFTGIMTILVLAMNPLASSAPGMIAAGTAILILSNAMLVMAGALKIFATMSWEEIGKGLTTVAGLLVVIAATMALMPGPVMVVTAAGILLLSVAINILAGAMKIFATMSWEEIAKGLTAMAGALLIIAGAMALMPGPMLVVTAAGLILVGVAINIIAGALKIMASMSWEEIGKGLTALAGALVILAGGLYLMTGTLAGSAALVVAAAALLLLAPALKILGGMSWEEIGKGLIALAGAFAVIGLAALLLTPIIPSILGLASAIALLGVGMALIGLGVLAFATAMSTLVAIGSLGVVALTAILQTVIGIIPTVMKALELALVAFAEAIIAAAPALIEAIVVVIGGLLDAIVKLTPKVVKTLSVLLDALIALAIVYIPKLVEAGYTIVTGILTGINKKLPKLMEVAGDLIVTFIKGLGKQALKITTAAGDTLITFMEGMTAWIRDNKERMNTAGRDLVSAIIDGMISGVTSLGQGVIDSITGLAGDAIDGAKRILGIASPSKVFREIGQNVVLGFVKGVVGGKDQIANSLSVITDQIKQARVDAWKEISRLKKEISDLKDEPRSKANDAAIAKAEAALKVAEANKKRLDAAYNTVTKEHAGQLKRLKTLAKQYDLVAEKLDDAKKKLADLQKVRDDYAKAITDRYQALPELNADTSLDTYFDNIRKSTEANIKFKATLDKLRELGLDDSQYKKFLEQGTDIQPFLDQLLSAGGTAIDELNRIDDSLESSASSLGNGAADALYKAGIDLAQGLVDGLESKLTLIADKMKSIGKMIADEIKKELGIKSPSKVFAEIGGHTMKGLALGIQKNTGVVDISARRAGQIAVEAMKKSLESMSTAVSGDMDIQPTIAPVLDLDLFRKDAARMADILTPEPLQASVSAQNAAATNNTVEANRAALEALQALQATGTNVELVQNNYSPKALSSAEIYRQTKSQLTIVKGALDK